MDNNNIRDYPEKVYKYAKKVNDVLNDERFANYGKKLGYYKHMAEQSGGGGFDGVVKELNEALDDMKTVRVTFKQLESKSLESLKGDVTRVQGIFKGLLSDAVGFAKSARLIKSEVGKMKSEVGSGTGTENTNSISEELRKIDDTVEPVILDIVVELSLLSEEVARLLSEKRDAVIDTKNIETYVNNLSKYDKITSFDIGLLIEATTNFNNTIAPFRATKAEDIPPGINTAATVILTAATAVEDVIKKFEADNKPNAV